MYRRNGISPKRDVLTPRLELNVWREPREDGWEYTRAEITDEYQHHIHGINCGCYPKTSNTIIPSMIYDNVHCPHYESENKVQPGQQQILTYPWTVQTFQPPTDLFGRESGRNSIGSFYRAPSAKSAPSRVVYRPSESSSLKKRPNRLLKSAPEKRDRKFKLPPTADSHQTPVRILSQASLTTIDEGDYSVVHPDINDNEKPLVTQFDSISRAATIGHYDLKNTNRSRIKPLIDRQFLLTPPNKAPSTPKPISPTLSGIYNNSPRRIFTGHYVDPRTGQKYAYDIKYKKHRDIKGNKSKVIEAI